MWVTPLPCWRASAAAATCLGDPTLQVRYARADGKWIDNSGAVVSQLRPGRELIAVRQGGRTIAGLDIDRSLSLPPLLIDLAVSIIMARTNNEGALALADARRAEVGRAARALVRATDRGRDGVHRRCRRALAQPLIPTFFSRARPPS